MAETEESNIFCIGDKYFIYVCALVEYICAIVSMPVVLSRHVSLYLVF